MLKSLLLILFSTGPGEASVAFAEAENLDDCEAKRDVVTQILTSAGQAPTYVLCGKTELSFSPYIHGTPPDALIHYYRIRIAGENRFDLIPLGSKSECDRLASPEDAQLWCAVSGQRVLSKQDGSHASPEDIR
ncbi:hypothetical protein [Paracoccus aerodenitrificans]|uniref:hypothetical protein n=1 Tax=Paracoccus aerodenitrificans TaxID=3017781 RepID=UPI0022F017D0|nr:hypothetical protein [Paracoccus aerodenitrificans]WBU62773.1 hypothetical protein PAE61_10340 [Paracoccus aerodenitrificans]